LSGILCGLFPFPVRLPQFCLLLLLLAPVAAPTQTETTSATVTVLVLPVSLSENSDAGFQQLLAAAMELQLEQAGLQPLRLSAGEEEALSARYSEGGETDLDADLDELLEISFRSGADFLLLGGYIKGKEEITLQFYLADVAEKRLLASTARQARIDFSLDRVMFQALEEMRPRVEQPIARVARRKAAAVPAGESDQSGKESQEATMPAAAVRPETIPPEAERPGEGLGRSEAEIRFRPHEFSLGFAPFVPLGWSSGAFNLSYAPFVYWNRRFETGSGVLGFGAFAAVNMLEPQEVGLASFVHTLISAGMDLRYTITQARRLNLFARLSAGAAVNVSDFSKLPEPEDLSRFMAVFAGGGGAMIAFSPGVGLAMDVTCQTFVYFWQEEKGGDIIPQWIIGLSPSLYIYTRL
jgi:hypothetical protein